MSLPGGRVLALLQRAARVPQTQIPDGRWLELPGRGRTWLTDVAGPPGAPAVVLLHAVGCTGLLTWFPVIEELARRYRVITFDQRWHGRGIVSEAFSLAHCADDVAAVVDALGLDRPIVAGYSMGGVIAQRAWRQHPDRVGGLVLAATTAHLRTTGSEVLLHEGLARGMGTLRTLSRTRVAGAAGRRTARALQLEPTDVGSWALGQWRSTSPWAVGQAVAALGRHHSTPWLSRIDVPTAVVVTGRDRVIPAHRQRAMAAAIPGATVHEADCGHAGCVLDAARFVPVFVQAVHSTQARVNDRSAERAG